MRNRAYRVTDWKAEKDRLLLQLLRQSEEADVTGTMELTPLTDNIIRVRLSERPVLERESDTVILNEANSAWEVEELEGWICLKTAALRVEVSTETGAIRWLDKDGQLVVEEPPDGGKALRRVEVRRTEWGEDAEIVEEQSVDGIKQRVRGTSRSVVDREAYSTMLSLKLRPDEAIYGLGQHEDGILDYRRQQQFLYQGNMKVALPTLVSSRGYAIHFDQHCFAWYGGNEDGCQFWSETVPQLEFYFIHGPRMDDLVRGLRQLTGGLPMLPRWAYGFIQSKERYETQEELLQVARRFRDAGMPLDCIVLDWSSWVEGLWGQKSLDPERFPDPKGMMEALHKMQVRLMVSIWPNMRGEGSDRAEMREHGLLLGNGSTYDSLNADARALYWKHAKEGLFDHGIDAWWCDCTEPFESDWNGSVRLPTWKRAQVCVDEFTDFMDPEWLNAFSVYHSRGIYEGQRASGSGKRVVNLTRSSGPSQQRFGTITWSGDIEARWSRMRKQVADGLNFVITGNPRWTLDIGAFFVKPGVQWFWDGQYPGGNADLGYRELYTRWFQMATFLPMFRSHGTDTAREFWNFGEPGTPFYDAIKAFTELRYRLIHYIYSLSASEVFNGYTMFRSLAFDFPDDPECLRLADQFMLGPALLVCPVFSPMYYEAHSRPLAGVEKRRRVYLPAGAEWICFWTGERFKGGNWVELEAPIDRIPVLVRAGSILPMGPVLQYTGQAASGPTEMQVYTGRDATFELYEDAGDGYAYESGEYCWTALQWNEDTRKFSLGMARGDFPSALSEDSITVHYH